MGAAMGAAARSLVTPSTPRERQAPPRKRAPWVEERRRRAARAGMIAAAKAFVGPAPRSPRPAPIRKAPIRKAGIRPMPIRPGRRLGALLVAMCIAFVLVAGRLTMVQGIDNASLIARGEKQRSHVVVIPARRGAIYDRNGRELALTVDQTTVWADPSEVYSPKQEAAVLAPILGIDAALLESRMTSPLRFVYLARRIDDATATRVRERVADPSNPLKGVYFLAEPKRFYPAGDLASSVLGRVDNEDKGAGGFEHQWNTSLAGKAGQLHIERDRKGTPIAGTLDVTDPGTPGTDMMLTLDRSLQYEVERALGDEIMTAGALGGIAVVMDTATGDILALANLKAGTNAGDRPVNPVSNEALVNVYEPGSVSKLITISGALDAGVITPAQQIVVPNSVQVGDHVFTEHEQHPVTPWSITDIVANSSNVGSIMIAQQLGRDRLEHELRQFGMGSETGLGVPGESAGLMPKTWYKTTLASVAIGQGVSVTAMQMVAAYNTIANGGTYIAPRLVKATIDGRGVQHEAPASDSHPVVSPETAAAISPMLAAVVKSGTGKAAAISGYTVAGKTGTARKPRTDGYSGYLQGAYVSSFAGFVPAENPALTAMVMLDQPTPIFGGLVAAPVFSRIAAYALREFRIAPPSADLVAAFAKADGLTSSGAAIAAKADGDVPAGAAATAPAATAPAATAPAATTTTGAGSGPTGGTGPAGAAAPTTLASPPGRTSTTRPPGPITTRP